MKLDLLAGTALAAAALPVLASAEGLLPDMRTVVPLHLQIQNEHQREMLRFSNGVANTGEGDWRMRPEFPLDAAAGTQDAIEQVLDADGNVVDEVVVSQFEFHETHNHWHIDGIALFEVRVGSPDGPVYGGASIKTTFCLIDWYALEGNSPAHERTCFDCSGDFQGISPGWVDQYHQATDGQEVDITGIPAGDDYYLVSIANHDGVFLESDCENNTAWVRFSITRGKGNGNAKLSVLEHSECDSPGLCGEGAPNR